MGRPLKKGGERLKVIELDPESPLEGSGEKPSRRLVVRHSPVRARKDHHDRQKSLEKLEKSLQKSKNPASLISNYGYKKFLKVSGQSCVELDLEKLEAAAKWDGLHGVMTTVKDRDPHEIVNYYKGLWQIEETFRVSKSDLKIRPIYHWTPERVRAHIALSFMALVCVRHLEYRVKLQAKKHSPEAIRSALLSVQVSILRDGGTNKRYGLPSKPHPTAKVIYQVMGKKHPQTPFLIS